MKTVVCKDDIEILDPPAAPQKPKNNLLTRLLPSMGMLIAAGVMAFFGGAMIIMSVISAGMAIFTSVLTLKQGNKEYKQSCEERIQKYNAYIFNKRKEIETCRADEKAVLDSLYISQDEEIRRFEVFSPSLFDRTPEDKDFLSVKLGEGAVEAQRHIRYKKQEKLEIGDELQLLPGRLCDEYRNINNAPVVCSFKDINAVGIVGALEDRYNVFKNIIIDIAARQYFQDVKMVFVAQERNADKIHWLRMLPQVSVDEQKIKTVVTDNESKNIVFEYLYKELTLRQQTKKHGNHIVIFLFDEYGLRLSLMATLAQEESRKTSERVKAGQKISRDNGVLYGNGNILGYDRVGDTYVINEEQAETVRMIYDLYLQGYGSMKIAGILTERKRKTASGLVKWSVSNIMRAIRNATYTGTKCYNKSRSNNFLEQKRINNLDMSTYEYVEGDFPAIISQEIWDKAQEIRESRVKPSLVSATKTTHSKRDSADVWVNKLRCSCGSSFRKNKWHTKLDGKTSYGYQCYNQLNNGNKKKREELGLDTDGYCDTRMITDWKLDFMAKALLEHLWTERRKSVLIAIDLIKCYYKEEKEIGKQSDVVVVQARLDKANTRLTNLIAMRADGEITKDEYQVMRTPVDTEIQELQKVLENIPTDNDNLKGFDLDSIISTLNSLVDFSGSTISHDVINQFVYLVTPTSDTTFEWYVNLNGKPNVKATFTAEGRKKNCLIRLEEIERISSLHRKENESNAQLIKNPCLLTYLHRLPSANSANKKLTQTA